MKKIISMILCLMLVLSLATTAFAAETTYQYEVYQIFTGDFSDGVLSNVKWGQNGKLEDTVIEPGDDVDSDTLDALEAVDPDASWETKLAVILQYADLTPANAFKTVTGTGKTLTIDNLPNGYYLVKDVAGSLNGVYEEAYTTYIVEVVDGEMTISRKDSVPSVEKDIMDPSAVKENEASIGETINYQITGSLPTNIDDYDTYYYVFTDTLSEGLTYTNNMQVTVNGKNVTDYFYKNVTVNEDGTTRIVVGIPDLLALELIKEDLDSETEGVQTVGDITNQSNVVLTYTAVLNENAVVGAPGNPNKVDLEYSNDPNNDGEGAINPPEKPDDDDEMPEPDDDQPTGKTPEVEVVTYTTELTIKKTDEDGKILTGAAFKITGKGVYSVVVTAERYEVATENGTHWLLKDGTYTDDEPNDDTKDEYADVNTKYVLKTVVETQTKTQDMDVNAYVGEDGTVKFTGLGAGKYTITETATPAGYNSIAPFDVEIVWNGGDSWTYIGTDEVEVEGETVNINQVTVVNQAGSTLPETGGIGTTLFYVFGTIMVLGAAVLLITKKRMSIAE